MSDHVDDVVLELSKIIFHRLGVEVGVFKKKLLISFA